MVISFFFFFEGEDFTNSNNFFVQKKYMQSIKRQIAKNVHSTLTNPPKGNFLPALSDKYNSPSWVDRSLKMLVHKPSATRTEKPLEYIFKRTKLLLAERTCLHSFSNELIASSKTHLSPLGPLPYAGGSRIIPL